MQHNVIKKMYIIILSLKKLKVYEKQIKEGRNVFVNAFLITIITTLFGGLCLTYMISSIIETIG